MKDINSVKIRLEEVIEPIIKDNFMELVDIEIAQWNHIRVKIGRINGNVSLDDCTFISRKIAEIEGLEGIITGNYSFEVSSPGIDRPLKKIADFVRFAGKKAKVVTIVKIQEEKVFLGFIKAVEGNDVLKEHKEVRINFDNIKKARLEEEVFETQNPKHMKRK